MKRNIVSLLVLLAVLFCTTVASASDLPSLFHNDDPWYKDGVSPLIERDGKHYIPADIFTMFDYMSVTTPTGNNLLIHNTDTDAYASILFLERSALINGTVYEDIGVFRDGGIYYVEADRIAQGVGFSTRLYIHEDGGVSMQICDDNVNSNTLTELIQNYYPAPEDDGGYHENPPFADTEISGAARIYLFCGESDPEDEFRAHETLEAEKLAFTLFLRGDTDPTVLIRHSLDNVCGLLLPDGTEDPVKMLDENNRILGNLTRQHLSLTLSSGDENTDNLLREKGYCPVKPDFTVHGGTDPDTLLVEILAKADEAGWCTVWLEDCWNTVEICRAMSILDPAQYRTSNYGKTAFKY